MNQFIQYFSILSADSFLKLAINLLFWFFVLAAIYFLIKLIMHGWGTKSYLVVFMTFSAFAMAIPYMVIVPDNISLIWNLSKTRLFFETLFLIGFLTNIFASRFIYHSNYLGKKLSEYLSSLVHLFIGFLSTIGFVVLYTVIFDEYFKIEVGFSRTFITLSIVTVFGVLLLWEVVESFTDKYVFGRPFMSPSTQDTILDIGLGVLGIFLAVIFVVSRQEMFFNLLLV